MKITNTDLRIIILEEIKAVFNEDYFAGNDDAPSLTSDIKDDNKLDPVNPAEFEKSVKELYDKLRSDPEFKKQFKPAELAQIMDIMSKVLALGADPDGEDKTSLLKQANLMLTRAVG
tara:strand:+ start:101 stop:451 length:351 start_codon:yes stop_codon:yes gene_type:complete